jgi:hypothetical protein
MDRDRVERDAALMAEIERRAEQLAGEYRAMITRGIPAQFALFTVARSIH